MNCLRPARALGSWNPTQGTDVCVCVYSMIVLPCVKVAALRQPRSYTNCVKKDEEVN
jgi:hypothetical protein